MTTARTPASVMLIITACLACLVPLQADGANEPLVVFLVRHAEKVQQGRDPALSDDGRERAALLVATLRDAGIEHIHSTDYRRTRDTAAPMAAFLGLDTQQYDPRDLPGLAAQLRARGGVHLVIGHSNTTPSAVRLLGGDPGSPIDEATEYDRLYIVTVDARGHASTVLLRYGPPYAAAVSWPAPGPVPGPAPAWPVSTPQAEGIEAGAVDDLVTDIEAGVYGLIDHFLLVRHGRIVADIHFEHDYEAISRPHEPVDHQYDYDHPAWHPYYRDTNLHTLQSVTKSITSLALGIAIDKGHIPEGVNAPAMSFFQAYSPDMSDQRRRDMTLEDMLTMRSGIDWNEMISYDSGENSCIQLEASDAWIQFVIDRPMREQPGTHFDYNSGVSVLIGKVIGVATGQRVDEWTREHLFAPLGIESFHWKTTPDGEVDTEGGLYLSSHDLARIGYFMLREGEWNGEQIVSREWVRRSTTPIVQDIRPNDGRDGPGYGYQWWIPDQADGVAKVFAGNGYGGQFVLVAPEHDIVAVFNGWNIHGGAERSTYRALQERILPAAGEQHSSELRT